MDERVARLRTPEECEQFIINVRARLPELAQAARRRSVELRAAEHRAESAAEREALAAVYALSLIHISEPTRRYAMVTRPSPRWACTIWRSSRLCSDTKRFLPRKLLPGPPRGCGRGQRSRVPNESLDQTADRIRR